MFLLPPTIQPCCKWARYRLEPSLRFRSGEGTGGTKTYLRAWQLNPETTDQTAWNKVSGYFNTKDSELPHIQAVEIVCNSISLKKKFVSLKSLLSSKLLLPRKQGQPVCYRNWEQLCNLCSQRHRCSCAWYCVAARYCYCANGTSALFC